MEQRRDRVVGIILFVLAAGWTLIAHLTIPPGYGGAAVGPRDFPIALGALIALLAALLFAFSFLPARGGPGGPAEAGPGPVPLKVELWAMGWTAGSLVAYALLMQWFGFVIATVVVVAVLLRLVLNVRSWPLLLAMPLGLGFGLHFLMVRLMAIYLPRGTIIQLF